MLGSCKTHRCWVTPCLSPCTKPYTPAWSTQKTCVRAAMLHLLDQVPLHQAPFAKCFSVMDLNNPKLMPSQMVTTSSPGLQTFFLASAGGERLAHWRATIYNILQLQIRPCQICRQGSIAKVLVFRRARPSHALKMSLCHCFCRLTKDGTAGTLASLHWLPEPCGVWTGLGWRDRSGLARKATGATGTLKAVAWGPWEPWGLLVQVADSWNAWGTFRSSWSLSPTISWISLGLEAEFGIHWLYPFSTSSGLDSNASGKIGLPSVKVRPLKSDKVRFTSSGASVSFPLWACWVLADTSNKSRDVSPSGSGKARPDTEAICHISKASATNFSRFLWMLHLKAVCMLSRCCLQACHVARNRHVVCFTSSLSLNLETFRLRDQQAKLMCRSWICVSESCKTSFWCSVHHFQFWNARDSPWVSLASQSENNRKTLLL